MGAAAAREEMTVEAGSKEAMAVAMVEVATAVVAQGETAAA